MPLYALRIMWRTETKLGAHSARNLPTAVSKSLINGSGLHCWW